MLCWYVPMHTQVMDAYNYTLLLNVLQLNTSLSGLKDESSTCALPHGIVMQVIVTQNYTNVNY